MLVKSGASRARWRQHADGYASRQTDRQTDRASERVAEAAMKRALRGDLRASGGSTQSRSTARCVRAILYLPHAESRLEPRPAARTDRRRPYLRPAYLASFIRDTVFTLPAPAADTKLVHSCKTEAVLDVIIQRSAWRSNHAFTSIRQVDLRLYVLNRTTHSPDKCTYTPKYQKNGTRPTS